MRKLVIMGSSRNDGNTKDLVNRVVEAVNWDFIDLNDYKFSYYDYNHENRDDDYLPLMKKVIRDYDILVFVTPVYWYSMSGVMKVFFDRITDLLTIEKDLGRKLRGKGMAALSCSGGNDTNNSFWLPFSESAEYLGMKYFGNLHTYPESPDDKRLLEFIKKIDEIETI